MTLRFKSGSVLALAALSWTMCLAQTARQTSTLVTQSPNAASVGEAPGTVKGTVVDQSGAVVTTAHVSLTTSGQSSTHEVLSDSGGQFSFPSVGPGPFRLTVTAQGFSTQTFSGVLQSGEIETVPEIVLAVAANVTNVEVGVPPVEVAEEQIKVEEKQRILGFVPNFFVSYLPNPVPLTPKQKFEIAWKTVIDPVTFLMVGGAAGVEQAQNHFYEYGQGAQGYAKRFGANYGDALAGTFIGGAILPSILKQDPRYYYKGTGSVRARALYAIAFSVICKGDNGRWQPNYSNVLGSLAAGGISNLYYPPNDRDGADLTFENAAIGLGASSIANLFQEFVARKLTPRLPKHDPAAP